MSQATLVFSSFPLIDTPKIISIFKWSGYFYNNIYLGLIYTIISLILILIGSTIQDLIDFKILKQYYQKKWDKTRLKNPKLKKDVPLYIYHRQETHSLMLLIIFSFIFLLTYKYYIFICPFIFYFLLGLWVHLAGDVITGSIPLFLRGKYYNFFDRIGTDRFLRREVNDKWNKLISSFFDFISPLISFFSFLIFLYILYKII